MRARRLALAPRPGADSLPTPLAPIAARIDALVQGSDARTEFPAEALAETARAVDTWRERARTHVDLTDIEFVTLDPAESTDLDQAVHLERTADGYRVRYAIADVPLFVEAGGALDAEARMRGFTIYLPDRRVPLHPEAISEGAASLLPGQVAPAFVWDMELGADARVREVSLVRALVRSREKLAYDAVQKDLDAGGGHPLMELLQEVGDARELLEAERGGASLGAPEQRVQIDGPHLSLAWRQQHPIERANAQISLMTGMVAAEIMCEAGTGILRTMPPAPPEAVQRFRRQAAALGAPWPEEMAYGDFLRTLDWTKGRHMALINQAASLFRGAGYEAFTDGQVPENPIQSALGAPYAHTTAPLRRLVDRFVLALCFAHTSGDAVDPDLLAALPRVPELMASAARVAGALEREAQEIVDVAVLATYSGERLVGTVIDHRPAKGSNGQSSGPRIEVQFREPPLSRWVRADAEVGTRVSALVGQVDTNAGTTEFSDVRPEPEHHTGPGTVGTVPPSSEGPTAARA